MKTIVTLVLLSLAILVGCQTQSRPASADATASTPAQTQFVGSGVQTVKLKLPGMT